MKFSIKKLIATALAAATLAGGSVIGASAYATSADWNVYCNPYQVRDPQTLILVTYGNGYKANMTGKSGGTTNRVVFLSDNINPVNAKYEELPAVGLEAILEYRTERTLDNTVNTLSFVYKSSDNPYILVDVDFEYSGGTYYSNQGTFSIR